MSHIIKLDSLRELVDAGGVTSATILGQKGGYAVVACIGMRERPLGTRQGDVRMFGRLDTAAKTLRDLGLVQFRVDVTHYEEGSLRAPRPDTKQRAGAAAEALAHDRWFREQVEATQAKIARGEGRFFGHAEAFDLLDAYAAQRAAERDGHATP